MLVTSFMIELAQFDIIPTDLVDDLIYYFPECEPFSDNFETVGVESIYMLDNIGFILWLIALIFCLVILHALLYACKGLGKCVRTA